MLVLRTVVSRPIFSVKLVEDHLGSVHTGKFRKRKQNFSLIFAVNVVTKARQLSFEREQYVPKSKHKFKTNFLLGDQTIFRDGTCTDYG